LTHHGSDSEADICFSPEVATQFMPRTSLPEELASRDERGQDQIDNDSNCAGTLHSSDEHKIRDASSDGLAAQNSA
jgi:hypothetical protein